MTAVDPSTHWPTTFCPGGEFTLGAEDELLLVEADGRLADHDCGPVIEALDHERLGGARPSREIFASQIEFNTPACADADALADCLARCRTALAETGQRALAAAVHPAAELGHVRFTRSPRYDSIAAAFGGVLRTPTAAFQVHVGLPDEEALVAAYRGIRNRLPLLRALSASSPFWHGQDSGLASARAAILRSYPRGGIPPVVRSYGEYEETVREHLTAMDVPDYTFICWDARPHPRYGTLEVRVMDAQCSVDRAAGLAALIQGMARYAVEHPPRVDLPGEVLTESDFRALRHGLDTRVVDLDGVARPLREIALDALGQARGVLAGDGMDGPLQAVAHQLRGEQGYERHRRVHQREGMPGLLADLMGCTAGESLRMEHRGPSRVG